MSEDEPRTAPPRACGPTVRPARWLCLLLAACLAAPVFAQGAAAPAYRAFDPAHTRFAFELRTRWGQRISGQFPAYDGELVSLPDGRYQVHIRLRTDAVEVAGSERYTALARGPGFFDAQRHPWIEFLSEPHYLELAQSGGRLRGRLSMHGASRIETFALLPSACARPGRDCDVVAQGRVSRDDYGLDGWKLLLGDTVRFTMRVRLQDDTP